MTTALKTPLKTPSQTFPSKADLVRRAQAVIPGCSNSFSKGFDQYAQSVSPHFLIKGRGARVEDVDGNSYLDFTMGLAPLILGYADPDVNAAIVDQLSRGTVWSLSSPLEIELAELLVEIIPCAEMVRYGKNGSDATTGAVRLARAYTGRDLVACCGYHGWHDWYIGTTVRNAGIPAQVSELTLTFPYNDLEAVEKLFRANPDRIACVILEPTTVFRPAAGYLEGIKALCRKYGALLIFDEIVTGFRLALGGAQEYFGVVPDLACFGKSMGNGVPIAVVTGRADIMKKFEDVFYSFTFAGEALGLVASIATINKLRREEVNAQLWAQGNRIIERFNAMASSEGLSDRLVCVGYGPRSIIQFKTETGEEDWTLKSLFQQECLRRGVLSLNCHNMSYAHTAEVVDQLLEVYRAVLALVSAAVASRTPLDSYLEGPALSPVFRRPM